MLACRNLLVALTLYCIGAIAVADELVLVDTFVDDRIEAEPDTTLQTHLADQDNLRLRTGEVVLSAAQLFPNLQIGVGQRIRVSLFEDVSLVVTVTTALERANGTVSIRGRVGDSILENFTLVADAQGFLISALDETTGMFYRVRGGKGRGSVFEMHAADRPTARHPGDVDTNTEVDGGRKPVEIER